MAEDALVPGMHQRLVLDFPGYVWAAFPKAAVHLRFFRPTEERHIDVPWRVVPARQVIPDEVAKGARTDRPLCGTALSGCLQPPEKGRGSADDTNQPRFQRVR